MRQRYRTLNDYFEQTGETQHAFAARLGVTPAYISMLRAGQREPTLRMALRIHELTGVPVEAMVAQERSA